MTFEQYWKSFDPDDCEGGETKSFCEAAWNAAIKSSHPEIVSCAFCGHQFPPGTPPSQHPLLAEHIKVCEKHPMRRLERTLIESHKLLSHYAMILNSYDEGARRIPEKLEDWIERTNS